VKRLCDWGDYLLPIQESGGTFPRWGRLINSRLSYPRIYANERNGAKK